MKPLLIYLTMQGGRNIFAIGTIHNIPRSELFNNNLKFRIQTEPFTAGEDGMLFLRFLGQINRKYVNILYPIGSDSTTARPRFMPRFRLFFVQCMYTYQKIITAQTYLKKTGIGRTSSYYRVETYCCPAFVSRHCTCQLSQV